MCNVNNATPTKTSGICCDAFLYNVVFYVPKIPLPLLVEDQKNAPLAFCVVDAEHDIQSDQSQLNNVMNISTSPLLLCTAKSFESQHFF